MANDLVQHTYPDGCSPLTSPTPFVQRARPSLYGVCHCRPRSEARRWGADRAGALCSVPARATPSRTTVTNLGSATALHAAQCVRGFCEAQENSWGLVWWGRGTGGSIGPRDDEVQSTEFPRESCEKGSLRTWWCLMKWAATFRRSFPPRGIRPSDQRVMERVMGIILEGLCWGMGPLTRTRLWSAEFRGS